MRGGDRSIGFRSDHNLDHLRLRTTWEVWTLQYVKARFSDEKARKSTQNEAKNRCRAVWEHDAAGSSPVTPTIFTVRKDCSAEKSLIIKGFLCFIRRFFNSILFAEKKAVFEDYRSRTGDFLMCLNISHFIKCQSQFALLLFIQLSAIQTRLSLQLSFFTEGIGKHRRLVFLPVVHNIIACILLFFKWLP